ncbi:MAG: hypothetical protein AB1585_14900 [Thermodesulfobacteriota bacterium]
MKSILRTTRTMSGAVCTLGHRLSELPVYDEKKDLMDKEVK